MKIIENSLEGIKEAAKILNSNGIVAFPTETVYGLGANAFSKQAVTKLYEIKRRPSFNPLIIHVSSYNMAKEYGIFNYTAEKLVKKYWPGPLTIIVKKKKSKVVEAATAKLETIALRCPSNIIASKLIRELEKPIAAPSANKSGKLTCTSPGDVFAKLNNSEKYIKNIFKKVCIKVFIYFIDTFLRIKILPKTNKIKGNTQSKIVFLLISRN